MSSMLEGWEEFEDFWGKHIKYIYIDAGATYCAYGTLLKETKNFLKIDNPKSGFVVISKDSVKRVENAPIQ